MPVVGQHIVKKRTELRFEVLFFRSEVEAQLLNARHFAKTLGASASNRQARNGFHDARNVVHSVTDQIANAREIVGFGRGNDVERTCNGIDSFH
jgi:hypothetical protein